MNIKPVDNAIVRFACKSDMSAICEFIDRHWRKDHILSRDPELFQYLYSGNGDLLNFVISTHSKTADVLAILGYIPTSDTFSRISLSIWIATPDYKYRKLKSGLAVMKFLINELNPSGLFSAGINQKTENVYKFLGYTCGMMNHHVFINNRLLHFDILQNLPQNPNVEQSETNVNHIVSEITTDSELRGLLDKFDFQPTGKDVNYLCHRYLHHPQFKYSIRKVLKDDQMLGLVIYRRLFANEKSCIRIIDVVGGEECLKGVFFNLIREMREYGDEYIDLVSFGLDTKSLENIGFIDRRKYGDFVVPEYFSPFSRTNVDIRFFTNLPETEIIYKGDGDQDRPN